MREMKDSGNKWIGLIPKTWGVERIKTIFSERSELSEDGSETLLSVSEYYGVANRAEKVEDGEYVSRAESLVGYKKCYKGDLVSNIMLAWKGSMGVTELDGIVSPAYCVYKPSKSVYPRYYHYLFRTSLYTSIFRLYSKGIIDSRLRLYSPYFFDIKAIIPSSSEQQKIADFLDRKCAEVDEMIALQEQIIEELKAYKQSVITEAVTKGLNPDVPMKDSGIEWIGEIPEHWVVSKLNYFVSKIGSGSTPTGGSEVYTNSGVKFLRSQNVYFDGFRLDEIVYITNEIDESMKGTRVLEGDVLLNITGGSIGRCYYVDSSLGRANVNQHVSIIRPSGKTNTKYLKYFLQSEVGQIQIQMLQTGGNREGLSAAALKEFRFLFLPLMEQQAISDYLDEKCADIDSLIQTKLSKIDSLKEYKKSIIYEYVTGKREVE